MTTSNAEEALASSRGFAQGGWIESSWDPAPVEFLPNPTLYQEFSRTVSDMARGFGPRTVVHALLDERKNAITATEIVAMTGKEPFEVDRVLALLESDGWVLRFTENGFDKYVIRGALRDDT